MGLFGKLAGRPRVVHLGLARLRLCGGRSVSPLAQFRGRVEPDVWKHVGGRFAPPSCILWKAVGPLRRGLYSHGTRFYSLSLEHVRSIHVSNGTHFALPAVFPDRHWRRRFWSRPWPFGSRRESRQTLVGVAHR